MAPDGPSKLLMLCPSTLHPLQSCPTDILSVPWATKLPLLRAFAHALTSILTVLWLGLVGSFLIFSLHIWVPFLEKHFLIAYVDCLCWLFLIAPQMHFLPFSTQSCVLRCPDRLSSPLVYCWDQRIRGWREVGDLLLELLLRWVTW